MEASLERQFAERLRCIVPRGDRVRILIVTDSYGRSGKFAPDNMVCISKNWNSSALQLYTHLPHEVSQLTLSGWRVSAPVEGKIEQHFLEGAIHIETLFSRKQCGTTFPPHLVIVVGGLNDVIQLLGSSNRRFPTIERQEAVPGERNIPNKQKADLINGYVFLEVMFESTTLCQGVHGNTSLQMVFLLPTLIIILKMLSLFPA